MAGTLPGALLAQQTSGSDGDRWKSSNGDDIIVHSIKHASFVVETPTEVIYTHPVGDAEAYGALPPPSLILVTHEHVDHYKPETLTAIVSDSTRLITNPSVFDTLPAELRNRAVALENGSESDNDTLRVTAVPAYNITADRLNYHPQGRDNGYVLTVDNTRLNRGDTEAVPEM